jgi:hypothetical protein
MRNYVFAASLVLCSTFISCLSEKTPDPSKQVDCSESDLTIVLDQKVDPTCAEPGKVTVSAQGGNGAYSYEINGSGANTTGIFNSLSAGTYRLSVKDENGCKMSVDVKLQIPVGGVEAVVQSKLSAGCGTSLGQIEVIATGGSGGYQFKLNNGTASSSFTFSNLAVGTYQVTVSDSEGCSTTTTAKINSGVNITTQIMPIIIKDCNISGCHKNAQSPNFDTEAKVIANAAKIKSQTKSKAMPQNGSLTANEIDLIGCWADDVAAGN